MQKKLVGQDLFLDHLLLNTNPPYIHSSCKKEWMWREDMQTNYNNHLQVAKSQHYRKSIIISLCFQNKSQYKSVLSPDEAVIRVQ